MVLLLAGAIAAGCSVTPRPARSPAPTPARLGTTTLRTGRRRSLAPFTLAAVKRWNPRLAGAGYAMVGMLQGVTMGRGPTTGGRTGTDTGRTTTINIWGKTGVPNVQLLLSGGRVLGVRGLFASADGPQPWFDQSATASAGWNVQTVWFQRPGTTPMSGAITFDRLKALNPALASARRLTDFVPMMGVHWGHLKPGLVFMVDRQNRVVAVEGTFGTASGWQPMYDQLPGHVDVILASGMRDYSEHVWFVNPSSIR